MRIGLVIDHFDRARGGAEHWTWQFAAWLAAGGHEVHVIASRFSPEAHRLPITCHQTPGRAAGSFAEAAAETCRRLPLEVVHDMGSGWHCDVFQPHGGSREAAFRQNLLLLPRWLRPLKRSCAGWLPRYRRLARLAARQYVDDGRIFVALSHMVAADFECYYRIPRGRIRVIYNGVDLERFQPGMRDRWREEVRHQLGLDDQVLVLIVAHNFALKGVPTLLRALAQLQAAGADVHLAVAGGKRPQAYHRLARRLGVAESVTFLGAIADPVPYYAAADVYAQPTFYDPCSLVVLEALAGGLPVVTSRFNGAAELITEGLEGYVIHDPSDAGELAARLQRLLNPAERREAGEAARRLALNHSSQRNFSEVLAVYREQAAAPRRAA